MKFSQIRLIAILVMLFSVIALTIAQISFNLTRLNEPKVVITQTTPIPDDAIAISTPPFVSVNQDIQTPNIVISPSPRSYPKSPSPIIQPIKPPSVTTPQYLPPQSSPPKFGHLPYEEAPIDTLKIVGKYYDRFEQLHFEAADAFQKMQTKARSDGVGLAPISGFRTVADQELLFRRQIKRQGSEAAAARLSAPPGFSEHHTGYAFDIGEEGNPSTDLKFDFEYTSAYSWLKKNAKTYGFKLSFRRNNTQGVSFEPWHWRYQESLRAGEIFKRANRDFS